MVQWAVSRTRNGCPEKVVQDILSFVCRVAGLRLGTFVFLVCGDFVDTATVKLLWGK